MFAITRKQKAAKLAKEQALQEHRAQQFALAERESDAGHAYWDAKIAGRVIGRNSVRRNQPIGDFRTHFLYRNIHTDPYVAGRYHQGILDGIQLGLEEGKAEQVNRESLAV